MPARLHTLDLPLLLTGIPAAVQDWLRQAGVPLAPLRIHHGVAPEESAESGRIVLYDSRSVASRRDAQQARAARLRAVDIAPLMKPPTRPFAAEEPSRGRFLYRLKQLLEAAGGLWGRLADYPHPWHGVACAGGIEMPGDFTRIADLLVPLSDAPPVVVTVDDEAAVVIGPPSGRAPMLAPDGDMAAVIRRCYRAGQPMLLPMSADGSPDAAERFLPNTARPPLLWQTTLGEFAAWWRDRDRWSVRVRQQDDAIILRADGPESAFTPMLELWHGRHVATIPLHAGEATLRRDGLLFQENRHRHPAGFTAQAFAQFTETVLGR